MTLSEIARADQRAAEILAGSPPGEIVAWFAARYNFDAPPAPPSDKIAVNFTFMDGHGNADSYTRNISGSAWSDIAANYTASASAMIAEHLVGLSPAALTGGKIAVLHGSPGTGKTHLIRSLIREWKPWARASYIMDVHNLFRRPSYMLGVLLDDFAGDRWNIIICEDAEEYIGPNAKEVVGQGLSQLLNTGDGMIGQGLRVLFLFTTNVTSAELHPAIIRPGRCFANLEIPKLTAAEASAWLGNTVTGEMTLAECYEQRRPTLVHHAAASATTGLYL